MPRRWEPSPDAVAATNLTRFQEWLDRERSLTFASYAELWDWSVRDLESFWQAISDVYGVRWSKRADSVLISRVMPGAAWFLGSELSYAENLFHGKPDDQVAIVHRSELREQAEVTWGELRASTGQIAAGLRALGVGPGDRVAGYLPNIPETVAAFLACASIGAIWSCCSPDFGSSSVLARFRQIEPKVLLAVDGYRYNSKDFDRTETVAELRRSIPGLEHTFVLPYLGGAGNWDALLTEGELEFEQLPFDHPLWILYSSGTTGLPKPIVHGQGGILLEHLKSLYLHIDARPGDRVFWFTTTGWMMWNLLVGGLLTDSAIVLYDGSPTEPGPERLWQIAGEAGVTCFGTSAAYIHACMKAGVEPRSGHDLSQLRSVGSTGSPLSIDGFRWIYDQLGPETWLFSMSGGTDVCTAFLGGVPTLPVDEGELQGRALGAKVEAFDDEGQSVVGVVGELVLTEPMPSMPIFFWGDADGSRYRESYFDTYPGIWRHGDWVEITSRGTAIILGRSDATINRGGIRMGTSEIYGAVLSLDEVVDALVVDVPGEGDDGWMPLFVVLRDGAELTDETIRRIKSAIRSQCSPRHVPDELFEVDEIPRTLSGKILEIPVKRILMGTPPERAVQRDGLANPSSLAYFTKLADR